MFVPAYNYVHSRSTVLRYNQAGWLEDLPSLAQARSHHACSSFVSQDGQKVSQQCNVCLFYHFIICVSQHFLVTGGTQSNSWPPSRVLDTTEVLTEGASAWRQVGKLLWNMARVDMKAINLGNTIYLLGEN